MARTPRRPHRLNPKQLRRVCDPRAFKFKTTATVPPIEGTVGQDRAVSAMDFGLSIEAEGFHLYVAGLPGTGRETELKTQINAIAEKRPAPRDWCYVFNFGEPAHPRALSLPPARGHELARETAEFIAGLRRDVPRAFESDEYAQRRDQVNRELQSQRERFFEVLEKEARSRELSVNVTPVGITTMPVIDGKPITKEQYDLLSDERKRQIQERTAELDSIIAQMAPQLRRLDRGAAQLFGQLDSQLMAALVHPRLDDLKRDYADEPDVLEFLDSVGTDVVEHLSDFRSPEEAPPQIPGLPVMSRDGVFERYRVNVVVTGTPDAHAPIVIAESPSYYHMFGRIDYRSSFGSMVTDHTMIKPGALHRANGGYLVVQALDVLTAPLVWETFKRALSTQQLRLENMGEQFSVIPSASLSPEPIPLHVKVA